jgi:hypothetical protein
MEDFKRYLKSLDLCDKSISDDMYRINMMAAHGIDFKREYEYVEDALEKTNLSMSTKKSCLRLCRRYHEFISK